VAAQLIGVRHCRIENSQLKEKKPCSLSGIYKIKMRRTAPLAGASMKLEIFYSAVSCLLIN
jgi:hypothetical protein